MIQDKLVAKRLEYHPEFLLRLHEVLVTWDLSSKPGLFVQARPTVPSTLDVARAEVRNALREGISGESNWWNSFGAALTLRSLHGITAVLNSEAPTWLTEVHRDGHMLAGVWEFPPASDRDNNVPVVASWYAAFFEEFFALASAVSGVGGLKGDFDVTATLVNANALRYANSTHNGQILRVAGAPSRLQHVQWTVRAATVGSKQWDALARTMAEGLAGAFRVPARG